MKFVIKINPLVAIAMYSFTEIYVYIILSFK